MFGVRRKSSVKKQHPDIENGVPSATANNSQGNNINSASGKSSSGVNDFLHRLDNDIDLRNKKNLKRTTPIKGDLRKASDLKNNDATTTANSRSTNNNNTSSAQSSASSSTSKVKVKRIILSILSIIIMLLIHDTIHNPPEKRILGSIEHRLHDFLLWVKEHPGTGAAAFIFVYGMCVVFLLPGTPLTLGGGYIYKLAYGWVGGIFMATFTSMAGSLFGSVSCFILGRYIMRNQVRKWGRKYPLFDAIDIAVSDNGFKIMCLLYLTPILPLGPVSYMCGTTSMPLVKFAMAKIAALPLMLLYVFIGASTDTFFTGADPHHDDTDVGATAGEEGSAGDNSNNNVVAVKKMGIDEETHRKMVLFGLILSIISMSLVSHFVKKELYKVSIILHCILDFALTFLPIVDSIILTV